jgi:hypothetical protein
VVDSFEHYNKISEPIAGILFDKIERLEVSEETALEKQFHF